MEQLVVWVADLPGALERLSSTLGGAGINVDSLVLTEAGRYGIVRIIVADPPGTERILKDAGFIVKRTEILGVELRNDPGQLARIGQQLRQYGVNIEYMYLFPYSKGQGHCVSLGFIYTESLDRAKEALRRGAANDVRIIDDALLAELGFFVRKETPP